MTPSQAMGTFLRTWRSEWAGLSRAQLAIAISTHLPKRKALSTKVIRKWEEGQPPNSTEELEGLCQVMRRNGLTRPEGEQFRQVVFQACVERQYAELFPDEDFAYDPAVEEKAHTLLRSAMNHNCPSNGVQLVACLKAVEAAIRGRPPRDALQPQGRRQDVALAILQVALVQHHGLTTRGAQRLAELERSSAYIADRFGGRLSPEVNCSGNHLEAMVQRAWTCRTGAVLPDMLSYERAMEEQGETLWAALVLNMVIGINDTFGDPDLRAALSSRAADHLAVLETLGGPALLQEGHYRYAKSAIAGGALNEAEGHLLHIASWAHGPEGRRKEWHHVAGEFHRQRGDPQQALTHYRQALASAESLGHSFHEKWFRQAVQICGDALATARGRRSRPGSGSGATP